MRAMINLDSDVVAGLERLRQPGDRSFEEIVNELLRTALGGQPEREARREPYRTPSHASGGCLIGSIDDVAAALAVAEGEGFR